MEGLLGVEVAANGVADAAGVVSLVAELGGEGGEEVLLGLRGTRGGGEERERERKRRRRGDESNRHALRGRDRSGEEERLHEATQNRCLHEQKKT